MRYDVIIVGAASAGLTAAIYASRQNLKTLVISKDLGGQALLTNELQNYPGYMTISGFELMSKFEEQAKQFGAEIMYDEVIEVRPKEDCPEVCFVVKTSTHEFEGTAVIFAFGKTPRDLGVPGQQNLEGRGVSYCAVCDGPLFKGRTVAVVGSSDPAVEAALLLSNLARHVHLVHAWDRPVGDEDAIGRALGKDNITFISNSRVTAIKGERAVEALEIQNTKTSVLSDLKVDGIFIELGYVAKTDFVKGLVQLNGRKEIIIDRECATSHPGIFAAGDVTDVPFKQAVISAGQGAIAALSTYNYIQRLRGRPGVRADWKVIPPKRLAA